MQTEELLQTLQVYADQNDCDVPAVGQEMVPILEALLKELETEQQKRKDAEEKLAFFRSAAEALPNPIFVKNDNLEFIFFNQAYRDLFGLKKEENIGKRVQDLMYLPQEDRERYHSEDSAMLDSLTVIQYDTPFEKADKKVVDTLYWSKGFMVPDTGERGLIGEIVDITKEKQLERKLKQNMAALHVMLRDAKTTYNTDPLTKLYNRNILESDIPALVREMVESGQPLCILMADVDSFKMVNDTFGHSFGDTLLRNMAEALTSAFRKNDIIIRYGGDEFVVVMPGVRVNQAVAAVNRLRDTVPQKCMLPCGNCVTPSVGITEWRKDDSFETALARADEALYEAKKQGKNRAVIR